MLIIYIASFPRSGNFWLQTLIGNPLKRATTRISRKKDRAGLLDRWIVQNRKYYDMEVKDVLPEESGFDNQEIAGWLTTCKHALDEKSHKALLPGCAHIINNFQTREILARHSEHFFVKTHALPFKEYFENEYVVQIVRNAGASIWSYFNFKTEIRDFARGLADLIPGDTKNRNWTFYHSMWQETAKQMGGHYLGLRYEDMFGRELEFCNRLGALLGLPVLSSEVRPFDFYHSIRPTLTRKGKASGREENFSRDEMRQLWETHKDMMKKYGYPEPNYELASKCTWLNQLI
jgi:Sulfotransferase domain